MTQYKNLLEEFISRVCYKELYAEVSKYIINLEESNNLNIIKQTVRLERMFVVDTNNVEIEEDTFWFEVDVTCYISFKYGIDGNDVNKKVKKQLTASCVAVVTDNVKRFSVYNIAATSTRKHPFIVSDTSISADRNLIPIIGLDELESEPVYFLKRYYPQALDKPMPIPIDKILTERMGLPIILEAQLSKAFSYLGQICLTKGEVRLYNLDTNSYYEYNAERGVIIIDPRTYMECNCGCINNLKLHEGYHWYRLRVHAAVKRLLYNNAMVSYRCSVSSLKKTYNDKWTDERRIEWQAEKITPRIQMPACTFRMKVDELYKKYGYRHNGSNLHNQGILESIIKELASFFIVSKQAAKIRMTELGYIETEAGKNNRVKSILLFSKIDSLDALREYQNNKEFKNIVDSGLFRYVDGYFVINNRKFISIDDDGNYTLSTYARENLDICTLRFINKYRYEQTNDKIHPSTFRRENLDRRQKLPSYNSAMNADAIAMAKEFNALYEESYTELINNTKTFSQRITELMNQKGWNAHKFVKYTRLEPRTYYRITRGEMENPTIETVINICIGLNVSSLLRDELVRLAGHNWRNNELHCAYRSIFDYWKIESPTDFNAAFSMLKIAQKYRQPLKDDN